MAMTSTTRASGTFFFCGVHVWLGRALGRVEKGTFIEEGTCIPRFFSSAFANLIVIFVALTAEAQPQAHAHAHIQPKPTQPHTKTHSKLLKNIGEEKSERLSKSQVTRTVEVRFFSCPCLYVLWRAFYLFI